MAISEENRKAIEADSKLSLQLKEMWVKGASAQEFVDTLTAAGLTADIANVEDTLAQLQQKRAELIGMQDVSEEQLGAIAGGGETAGVCNGNWNACEGEEACTYDAYCRNYFGWGNGPDH